MNTTFKSLCAAFSIAACAGLGSGCGTTAPAPVKPTTTTPTATKPAALRVDANGNVDLMVMERSRDLEKPHAPVEYFEYQFMNDVFDEILDISIIKPKEDLLINGAINQVRKSLGAEHAHDTKEQITAMINGEGLSEDRHQTIIREAITGALAAVSPHDTYATSEELDESLLGMKILHGIGILHREEKGKGIIIAETVPGGPADRAGIRRGDIITKVDGVSLADKRREDASALITGTVGTPVVLSVIHRDETQEQDITVKRHTVAFKPVRHDIIGNDVCYISLRNFGRLNTHEQIADAVATIKTTLAKTDPSAVLKGCILDLRGNPGGLVSVAGIVADSFIDKDNDVSVRVTNRKFAYSMALTAGDVLKGLPLAIAIDDSTASAAEIFTGAMQIQKRATVFGLQSFGKGSVQSTTYFSQFDKANYDGMRITTALYQLSDGRYIQNHGITPDVLVKNAVPQLKEHERDMVNVIANPYETEIKTRAPASECATNSSLLGNDLPENLRDYRGKPDHTLLCAYDHLRKTSQYTQTGPAKASAPAP